MSRSSYRKYKKLKVLWIEYAENFLKIAFFATPALNFATIEVAFGLLMHLYYLYKISVAEGSKE